MWKPSLNDIEWMRALISKLADGANWITYFARFQLDKANKILYVREKMPGSEEDIRRVKVVCRKLGWKVILEPKAFEDEDRVDVMHVFLSNGQPVGIGYKHPSSSLGESLFNGSKF